MLTLPSVTPFAALLADLAIDLRRGTCCLITADKGWTLPLCAALQERLRAAGVRWDCLDGRPRLGETSPEDAGIMLLALAQIRQAVRTRAEGCVLILPHLDVMANQQAGWTAISCELVPLLYENPTAVLLGFRDATLPLLPVIEKLFPRRYTVDRPYRDAEVGPAKVSPRDDPGPHRDELDKSAVAPDESPNIPPPVPASEAP